MLVISTQIVALIDEMLPAGISLSRLIIQIFGVNFFMFG